MTDYAVVKNRADAEAYARYLAAMDASMKQKVALTAAHLLAEGRIADMGMGSGAGSFALAALYPRLNVIGVDLDPEMVTRATDTHRLPNLSFLVGDIAAPVFPEGTLDGIFDSSVLHHVTSFTGYKHEAAARALEAQAKMLRLHGVLVVRDFLAPEGAELASGLAIDATTADAVMDGAGDGTPILLDLPENDGDAGHEPRRCSTAALFERFAREFRSLHPKPGFDKPEVVSHDETGALPPPPPGFRRYRVPHRLAVEFALRKDYRDDWESEVKEEYTYMTQQGFERVFARLGLRVLASTPLVNPWIVKNRFEGRIAMRALDGHLLEPPATNYVIVGERVASGEGVGFRAAPSEAPIGFLEKVSFRHRTTGARRDLVRRPGTTVDVLPYFTAGEDLYVLARTSYPRPIPACAEAEGASLDGARAPAYLAEPIAVIRKDAPLGRTVEEALGQIAGLDGTRMLAMAPNGTYYPSPGGLEEEVTAVRVLVTPTYSEEAIGRKSAFATRGRVRAIEARQVLRAAQVSGLPEARLELNVYELCLATGREVGPWIGEALTIGECASPPRAEDQVTMAALAARPQRRVFERSAEGAGFLAVEARRYEEVDREGRAIASAVLEYVTPVSRSPRTVVTAPLARFSGELWLGLDDDDLPASQSFSGHSDLLVAPAWRLPHEVTTRSGARSFVRERLLLEYGVEPLAMGELGGRYLPSAGTTPEVVHALAVEVSRVIDLAAGGERRLRWVRLEEVVQAREALVDGHLRIVALRAAHALGILR